MAGFPLSSLLALSFHPPTREALKNSPSPTGGREVQGGEAGRGREGRRGRDRGEGRTAGLLFPLKAPLSGVKTQDNFPSDTQRPALCCSVGWVYRRPHLRRENVTPCHLIGTRARRKPS